MGSGLLRVEGRGLRLLVSDGFRAIYDSKGRRASIVYRLEV